MKLLDRLRGVSEGDPVKELIMEEESLEWEWQARNFRGIVDRLQPWVSRYPINQYDQWEPELQKWATWVHFTYHIALANTGDLEGAEQGLRGLVENIPLDQPDRPLADSWCWLGHVLGLQHRYAEGVAAYEMGLALDVADIDPEEAGVPIGFDQPRVRGGEVNDDWRAGYVAAYQKLLKWRALGDEFERLQREEGK